MFRKFIRKFIPTRITVLASDRKTGRIYAKSVGIKNPHVVTSVEALQSANLNGLVISPGWYLLMTAKEVDELHKSQLRKSVINSGLIPEGLG